MPHHIRILAGRLDRSAGSHVYNQELVCRLAMRGHRVSVVCFQSVPEVQACAEVYEVPPGNWSERRLIWRLASWLAYRQCSRGLWELDLPPADIVIAAEHLHLKAHHLRFPQTPWVYLPHSLLVDQEIYSYNQAPLARLVSNNVYCHLQKWSLQSADRTLRFTRHAGAELVRRYGHDVRSLVVVNPMGVEPPEPLERPEPSATVRLLWVGQLIPRKRIDLALAALARFKQHNWRFDIVGGGNREVLEQQSAALGLTDRVHFHGFQKEPWQWYRQADLLVFPSWLENSPVTMLEAMSYGVPTLAMRADGVRFHNANAEILEHGGDGFLADTDEDFAQQLGKLIQQPTSLRRAGAAARQTILDRHTWDKHLDRYEQLFDELCHPGLASPELATLGQSM